MPCDTSSVFTVSEMYFKRVQQTSYTLLKKEEKKILQNCESWQSTFLSVFLKYTCLLLSASSLRTNRLWKGKNCYYGYQSPIDIGKINKKKHQSFQTSPHFIKLAQSCTPAHMRHIITAVLILRHCFSHSFIQVPVLGVNLQTFPILGIIGGFLYSTYNYFYVILNGGVGKNGSTVAVSALLRALVPIAVQLFWLSSYNSSVARCNARQR